MMAALFSVSLFATTYTVAGNSIALFGAAWDTERTANDMVLAQEQMQDSRSMSSPEQV